MDSNSSHRTPGHHAMPVPPPINPSASGTLPSSRIVRRRTLSSSFPTHLPPTQSPPLRREEPIQFSFPLMPPPPPACPSTRTQTVQTLPARSFSLHLSSRFSSTSNEPSELPPPHLPNSQVMACGLPPEGYYRQSNRSQETGHPRNRGRGAEPGRRKTKKVRKQRPRAAEGEGVVERRDSTEVEARHQQIEEEWDRRRRDRSRTWGAGPAGSASALATGAVGSSRGRTGRRRKGIKDWFTWIFLW